MAPKVSISVAIYEGASVYKHWSLFVEGPEEDDHQILQIMGSSQRYRFEVKASNARESAGLEEIVPVCKIPADKVEQLNEAAQNQEIRNDIPAYNCQDWVIDLLSVLEREKIIDGGDKVYQQIKERLEGKVEGLN